MSVAVVKHAAAAAAAENSTSTVDSGYYRSTKSQQTTRLIRSRYAFLFMPLVAFVSLFLCWYVYEQTFRRPREQALTRALTRWYDATNLDTSGTTDDGTTDHHRPVDDRVSRRDQIIRLRESLGIGLDSLPTVRFRHSHTAAEESKNKDTSGGGDPNDTDLDEQMARARQQDCLTVGAYISPLDEYVDCRAYCAVNDGVTYRYMDRADALLNGRLGRVGAYCLPNDAANCNTNTSLAVYGRSTWRCMPQTRAFAGEGGNMIVACDGTLLDRATGRTWVRHIDSTLAFRSIDEKLPGSTHEYRFVCPPGIRDYLGNRAITASIDRLMLLDNTCASLIPYASDDICPDFDWSQCNCGENGSRDRESGLCVPYANGVDDIDNDDDRFDERTLSTQIVNGVRLCAEMWSTNTTITELSPAWRIGKRVTPCGIEYGDFGDGGSSSSSSSSSSLSSRPACVCTRAFVYDRVVPSPYAIMDDGSK